jgi:hypothetical protein
MAGLEIQMNVREEIERHIGVALRDVDARGRQLKIETLRQGQSDLWAATYEGDPEEVGRIFFSEKVNCAYRLARDGQGTLVDEKWVEGELIETRPRPYGPDSSYPW